MPKKVPYLYEEQIERDAEALLADYQRARGIQIDPREDAERSVETCKPALARISRDVDRYHQYWENEAGNL